MLRLRWRQRHRGSLLLIIAAVAILRPGGIYSQELLEQRLPVPPQAGSRATPSISLDQLIQEALERNPAIQAARRAVDAKRAMVLPAQTLPDPMVGFQTMGNLIPPTLQGGDPSSARAISFEQELPFPGKLSIKGKIAAEEVEVEWWNYEQARRQVVSDLKLAYFDLCFIDKSMEIVQKDKDLLQKLVQIAEAKYRVGQGIQQDVLKAQVEISKLIDRLAVLEQRRGIAEARISSLLYRPPETPLGPTPPLQKAELRHTLEELHRIARSNAPELKMQEREIDRNQYAVELARKEFYPDFSAGFTYYNRTAVPEMFGLMFKATIPLYFWRKQRPELESAASGLARAQKQREGAESMLYFKLKDSYLMATTSDRLMELYRTGVIPQSILSLDSAVAGYQVGKVDFLTLIDNLVTLLDYELKYNEVLTDYQKALAQLEPLVGIELAR
ncbi:MAG: TolC family protein [Acidobacteria bacterium]|nr:TolC family protein [Acidobacteriota bacterium]